MDQGVDDGISWSAPVGGKACGLTVCRVQAAGAGVDRLFVSVRRKRVIIWVRSIKGCC